MAIDLKAAKARKAKERAEQLSQSGSDVAVAEVESKEVPQESVSTSHAALNASERALQQQDSNALILSLDQIVVRKQVRKKFDPDYIRELANNIKKFGQFSSINVIDLGDGRYELDKGECRCRAYRLLQEEDPIEYGFIRALKVGVADGAFKKLGQLSENIFRQALLPIEEAEAMQEVMDEKGWNAAKLAEELGKPRNYVTRALDILNHTTDETKSALTAGEVKPNSVVVQEEIKEVKAKKKGTTPPTSITAPKRVSRLSIPQDTVENMCLLLKQLASEKGLPDVVLSDKPTGKELIAVLELRLSEFIDG